MSFIGPRQLAETRRKLTLALRYADNRNPTDSLRLIIEALDEHFRLLELDAETEVAAGTTT